MRLQRLEDVDIEKQSERGCEMECHGKGRHHLAAKTLPRAHGRLFFRYECKAGTEGARKNLGCKIFLDIPDKIFASLHAFTALSLNSNL